MEYIVQSIIEIEDFLIGINNFEEFKRDYKTKKAVERNLEIIGEASKKISTELKNINQEIEWRKIAGLRDFLAHGYFEIDDSVIWEVTQNKLPCFYHSRNFFKSISLICN